MLESRKKQLRLTGRLRSAAEKRLALQTASDVAGVKSVIDGLEIRR